jgi:hypothetical protein
MALRPPLILAVLLAVSPVFGQSLPPPGGFPVVTDRYDNLRSGANLKESQLRPDTIASDDSGKIRFGKLFTRSVDAPIYAQPLYVPDVLVPGKGKHNIVYVATANNSVYAFDADSCTGVNAVPLWYQNLGPAVPSSRYDASASVPLAYALRVSLRLPLPENFATILDSIRLPYIGYYRDIAPKIGIIGTPVIDLSTHSLYAVAALSGVRDGQLVYEHRIFVLDITTGKLKRRGVPIVGKVPGFGDGSNGSIVAFDSYFGLQQSALLLDHGTLYIAFGAHGDIPTVGPQYTNGFLVNRYGVIQNLAGYAADHGWLFAYDARTLLQAGVFCTSPNVRTVAPRVEDLLHLRLSNPTGSGIGMGGVGPAADAQGNVYIVTGRGIFDRRDLTTGADRPDGTEYGNSVLRLTLTHPTRPTLPGASRLTLSDYFTPPQQLHLSLTDNPSGGGGVVLLPTAADGATNSQLALTAALGDPLYLLKQKKLGNYSPLTNPNVTAATTGPNDPSQAGSQTVAPTPVYWYRPPAAPNAAILPTLVYLWVPGSGLQTWDLHEGTLTALVHEATSDPSEPLGTAPMNLTVSANAAETDSGILWAASAGMGASTRYMGGVLRAYAAGKPTQDSNSSVPRLLWSSETDVTGTDAPGSIAPFTAPMVAAGKVYLPTTSGTLVVYGALSDRGTIPATAAITIDSDNPTVNYERDEHLRILGSLAGGIRRAGLVRFVVPSFQKSNAPVSAFLTLHLYPSTVEARETSRNTEFIPLYIFGVDGAGNWQPSQVTWSHLPETNNGQKGSRVANLSGGGHPVSVLAERAKVALPVTFDVTRWVRAHPGQAITLLLWSPSLQPLTFFAKGNNAPLLTVNGK